YTPRVFDLQVCRLLRSNGQVGFERRSRRLRRALGIHDVLKGSVRDVILLSRSDLLELSSRNENIFVDPVPRYALGMEKRSRPRRDFDSLETRRKQAARMFTSGQLKHAEIARRLGTTRTSVHRWYRAWLKEGTRGLCKAGRAGRTCGHSRGWRRSSKS